MNLEILNRLLKEMRRLHDEALISDYEDALELYRQFKKHFDRFNMLYLELYHVEKPSIQQRWMIDRYQEASHMYNNLCDHLDKLEEVRQ